MSDRLAGLKNYIDITVDSREQYPLLFPTTIVIPSFRGAKKPSTRRLAVRTFTQKMDSGDYCLRTDPSASIIERKGSAHEVIKNLFNRRDAHRQGKSFKRLADATDNPYLLLAFNPQSVRYACKSKLVPQAPKYPDLVYNRLADVAQRYGLSLLWMSSTKSKSARRAMGSLVIHIMLSHLNRKEK